MDRRVIDTRAAAADRDIPIPYALTEDAAQLRIDDDAPPIDWTRPIERDPRLELLEDDEAICADCGNAVSHPVHRGFGPCSLPSRKAGAL
jgi:hypothetical protein